ncbi:hypothetical protein C2845_PM05G06540 [Panicum miliaceum]|uniref:Uncharacterized protein n=1 Tax=Panicum miliaceum TaxID=4540 RepID=A0A3L6SW23_PANMI|nr:hypothetical protein C2845_PM05G06540 [Panicum miliaceum]
MPSSAVGVTLAAVIRARGEASARRELIRGHRACGDVREVRGRLNLAEQVLAGVAGRDRDTRCSMAMPSMDTVVLRLSYLT